jgi:hypothetical protein
MISPSVAIVFILICIFLFFGLVVFLGAPYVPSHRKDVKKAFEHFDINNSDLLVDAGSGDGLVLRIASSFGAKAVGYATERMAGKTARRDDNCLCFCRSPR